MPKGNPGKPRPAQNPWTRTEEAFLAYVDPATGSTCTDAEFIARFPNRDRRSILNKRRMMGIVSSTAIERQRRERAVNPDYVDPVEDTAPEPDEPFVSDEIASLLLEIGDAGATGDQLRELFRGAHRMAEIGHLLAPSQTHVSKTVDDALPHAVCFTGDWHVGAAFVDTDSIDRHMQLIRDTDGLSAIHMGDIVEGTTKDAKWIGSLLSTGSVGNRDFQDEMATELMRVCRDKWIAICDGNHDAHLMKMGATNHTANIAKRLDVPYFREAGGTVFVTVGGVKYVIAVKHTYRGNSRLNTSNAQRVMFGDWPEWQNCDVINLAHFHFNDMHKQTRKGGACVYLRSGTYKVHDSYSQDQGYTPEWGIPLVVLMPNERKVIPFRGDDFDAGLRFLKNERARYAALLEGGDS